MRDEPMPPPIDITSATMDALQGEPYGEPRRVHMLVIVTWGTHLSSDLPLSAEYLSIDSPEGGMGWAEEYIESRYPRRAEWWIVATADEEEVRNSDPLPLRADLCHSCGLTLAEDGDGEYIPHAECGPDPWAEVRDLPPTIAWSQENR